MPPRSAAAPARLLALVSLLLMGIGGCDPGFPSQPAGEAISEETFVETMVALRRAAVNWELRRIPPAERDSILAARGVSPEDLLRFVEIRGTDVPYMNRVWTRVEAGFTGRPVDELAEDVPDAGELVEEGLLPPEALPEREPPPLPQPELPPGDGGR